MTVHHERRVRPGASRIAALLAPLALVAALLLGACSDEPAASSAPSGATPSGATATEAAGASPTASVTATEAGIEEVDSAGTTVTLERPAQRIVSHSPGATEILFAIGAGAQMVAADEFSDYPAEAAALPKVAYTGPDPEQDLAHDPDLVILAGNQEQSVAQFRAVGVPVFYLEEPEDLDGVLESILLLGRLAGREAEAEALAADLGGRLDAIRAAVADVEAGPRVFYELDSTLYTVSPDTFLGSALALLKAQNIAEGASSPYPQLTAEAVVAADPEVVLLADAAFGVSVESVGERPGWSAVSAVRDGRIYPVDQDILSRPGPRIVDGIESLAPLLYPERFE